MLIMGLLYMVQATRSQSIWRRLEELQVKDENEIQHLGTNKYIPLVSCISNLFTSWYCVLKSRSIMHGYTCKARTGVESEFSLVWSQGGADYTASPFPEHN